MPSFEDAVRAARASAQSPREYVDAVIAASPGWEFRDVRYGSGHGGCGTKLYAGDRVIDVSAASPEAAAIEAVEQMLEAHGIAR